MKEQDQKIAERFNILDKIQILEKELLQIKGVTCIEFDLYGFYDNMHQVIGIIGKLLRSTKKAY